MRRKAIALGSLALAVMFNSLAAYAGEIGHYVPGLPGIRDLAMPAPGFYGVIYNYGYSTGRFNDANGNKVSSVTVGTGLVQTTLNVDVNVNAYALAPALIWVAKSKVLGAHVGAYVLPTFQNTSLSGLISNLTSAGLSAKAGQFNVGDTFVQPVWLGWSGKHYDVGYGYGFYIPSGKYQVTTATLPKVGDVSVEAPDNTGLGFWTNQNQGTVYLYPWADRRLAVENALTWEIHQKKRNFDLTPGQDLTWNWGLSQFLPLKKESLLLEVGPAGYSSFQVTDDRGTAASNPGVHDKVHAVGLQVGVLAVKKNISLNFHWFHEFSAADRFKGSSIGLNLSVKL